MMNRVYSQLCKLKKDSQKGNAGRQKDIEKLAGYLAKLHMRNIKQSCFEMYNTEQLIQQVYKIKDVKYKNGVISALETMSQIEAHNVSPKSKFSAWDIAYVINFINDSKFSEIFLESYLRHGGEKPTLTALYTNLYYVKVSEAVKKKDFGTITEITENIINGAMFNTDIISYETLSKLNIIGY
jgi:hypothetical protein